MIHKRREKNVGVLFEFKKITKVTGCCNDQHSKPKNGHINYEIIFFLHEYIFFFNSTKMPIKRPASVLLSKKHQ